MTNNTNALVSEHIQIRFEIGCSYLYALCLGTLFNTVNCCVERCKNIIINETIKLR